MQDTHKGEFCVLYAYAGCVFGLCMREESGFGEIGRTRFSYTTPYRVGLCHGRVQYFSRLQISFHV